MSFGIPERSEIIKKLRDENKKIALVLPIYYPAALLRSFDIFPLEIWNSGDIDLSKADEHLQSYTCSLGRIILSFIKEKNFERDYDMILVPHICDTFQQIGSLLVDFIRPKKPVINFYIPRRTDEIGRTFGREELKSIILRLEEITNKKFDGERFIEELETDIEINRLMSDIYSKRESLPLSDREFYEIILSRTYLPPLMFAKLLNEIVKTEAVTPRMIHKRLFISGISFESLQLFDIINSLKAGVVFDDLAISQRRIFSYDIDPSHDPLKAQIDIILKTEPDPEKGSPISQRAERLIEKAKRTGVQGGIFYIMKFCEPEFFDYPSLRNHLNEAGIRTFLIEYEMKRTLSRQNINRLQSFIEGL